MVFLVLSMMNGLAALYAMKIKHLIKPIYIKLCHYLTGIVAFVIGKQMSIAKKEIPSFNQLILLIFLAGMVSLMLEYSPRRMQSAENVNMLISFSSITIILTLIGVSKTMLNQFKGMMS